MPHKSRYHKKFSPMVSALLLICLSMLLAFLKNQVFYFVFFHELIARFTLSDFVLFPVFAISYTVVTLIKPSKNNNTFVAMFDLLKIQVLKTIPLLRLPHLRSAFLKLDTAFFSPFCYLFVRQINVCAITSPV